MTGIEVKFSVLIVSIDQYPFEAQLLGLQIDDDRDIVGNLSNYEDDDKDNVKKNNRFYEQNNCSARASRFLVHFFDVHCTITTWNLPMRRFVEDVDIRRQIVLSLFELG